MTIGVACPNPLLQFFLNNGQLAAGGSILTQVGGVNAATYQDSGLTTPLSNPIPLNSRGEVSNAQGASCQLFLTPNQVYTFTLFDAGGNQIWIATYVNGVQVLITQASVVGLLGETFVGGPSDAENIYFHRTANYAGGTAGFVNSVLRTQTDVTNVGSPSPYEWTLTSVMNNSSATGQQVAIYGQGNRVLSTAGPTWAATFEARDQSGQSDPTVGFVSVEIDMRASGTDTNNARVGCDLVVTRYPVGSGAAMQSYCGYRVQNGGDNSAVPQNCYAVQSSIFGNGFTIFQGSTGTWGINFAQATLTSGAMLLPANAPICFDANANTALYWDGTCIDFDYGTSGRAHALRIGTAGATFGQIGLAGVNPPSQVTGWGTPTGAGVIANFPGGSATLAQCSEVIAQILTDLKAMGRYAT